MNIPDYSFAGAETVLDVGGWFKPEPRATHVVDLMPWETRGVKLTLTRSPNERFSKATWFQTDFLKPDFRLPFADKFFDLVVCGHTIEDLANPRPLLAEMQRVGKRGIIECPSRLTEQTKGFRDRQSGLAGHPHHHWIVESVGGRLLLYSKTDSGLHCDARLLPLLFAEQILQKDEAAGVSIHAWSDVISYSVITGVNCQRAAEEFITSKNVPPQARFLDAALRFTRRMRSKARGLPPEDFSWWPQIVEVSRQYSTIELK